VERGDLIVLGSLERTSRSSWFETSSEALDSDHISSSKIYTVDDVFVHRNTQNKTILFFMLSIPCIFMSKYTVYFLIFFYHDATAPSGPRPTYYRGFMITLRHTTLGRTPLDECSARRTDLYLTIHNTHKRQTSMTRRDSNPQSQQSSGRRPTP